MTMLMRTDDHSALQAGCAALRGFIRAAGGIVPTWKDAQGVTGLQHLVQFLAKMLAPGLSDSYHPRRFRPLTAARSPTPLPAPPALSGR